MAFLTWWLEKSPLELIVTFVAGFAIGFFVCYTLHCSLDKAAFYGVGLGIFLLMLRTISAAYVFFHARSHK